MKKEIVVENFRKSPSNIHHLIVVGEDKTLCGLNKNEDPKLWEIQLKGEGLVCKNCQKALFNLKKEREKEDDCGCSGNCGDNCKCEKQEEIPFNAKESEATDINKLDISKTILTEGMFESTDLSGFYASCMNDFSELSKLQIEQIDTIFKNLDKSEEDVKVKFVKKSTSKIQHIIIDESGKTLCGLDARDSIMWSRQSIRDNDICMNCIRAYAKKGSFANDLASIAEDLKIPKVELETEIDTRSDEQKRADKIREKNAYRFPKAPNDPMPYDMAKRRMELEERGFSVKEIKAIIYNEFFDMDMMQLEGDCAYPECDPKFEGSTIGLTSRANKSQSDESLGLNVDDHKEIFDELNRLYRKGILPISVIHRLFGTDIDGSLDRTERFIELVQSTPTITDEVRQSGKEALEETFMKWKDSCVSGNKKLPDHEFFYRIMKIQEILS